MTRRRDDDFVLPSHAAILRQQKADACLSEPAHVGIAPPVGSENSHAPGAENKQQEPCWVVCDPEEPLRYI